MTLSLKLPALLIVAIVATLTLSPRCLTSSEHDDQKSKSPLGYNIHRGVYENYEYGYTVRIPDRHVGISDASPNPQHGFYIDLGPSGKIWVDGSYNSLMWGSVDAATDYSVEQIRKES